MSRTRCFLTYRLVTLALVMNCAGYSQLSTRDASAKSSSTAVQPACGTITHEQADAIIRELQEIRHLLETEPPSSDAAEGQTRLPFQKHLKVASNWHFLGNRSAPVTLVEFTDYQCPYCRGFHERIFPELKTQYIDTGKMLFVSIDSPLPFHPNALYAAQAAQCAGDQGKFWEMRDTLLKHNDKLNHDLIVGYARALGLDAGEFEECLRDQKHQDSVQEEIEQTRSLGIPGTPAFLISKSSETELVGDLTFGVHPFYDFQSMLSAVLGSAPQPKREGAVQPLEAHANRSSK